MNSEYIHPDKTVTKEGVKTFYLGGITKIQQIEVNLFEIFINNNKLYLQILKENVFRIKFSPEKNINLKPTSEIIIKNEVSDLIATDDEDFFWIETKAITIKLRKSSFLLTVLNKKGELVSSEVEGSSYGWNENHETYCHKTIQDGERFYGFGEKTGYLEKSHTKQVMWNSDVYAPHNEETNELYQSIPFYMSVRNNNVYGLFLDNPSKTEFDLTNKNEMCFKTAASGLDYYFFYGQTMKDVLKDYTTMTGKMPMPPLWALGYQQSRYSYRTEEEVRTIAKTFREKQIPCDVMYLDIHHMDEYRVFSWHPDNFKDAKKLVKDLSDMGFHVVPIVDPGVKVDDTYEIYNEGVKNDYFSKYKDGTTYKGPVWAGESVFPDFSKEEVRKWWGEKHEFFTKVGIKGIWNDMNEPSVFNETKTLPDDVIHESNGDQLSHKEYHNFYGYHMSKSTYEGMKNILGGERPFVVTRAGYAGIQKYAAVWTGDNRSFWDHLAMSIPMFLNLGLSGVPFVGADVGGFAHYSNGPLLARWTQLGAFTPFFRNHCVLEAPNQEPWVFGEEIEGIVKKYIELRYKLMPYFYNVLKESSETGMPFLRPLVLEYPHDTNTYNLSDQMLIGDSILIAPVYRPDTQYRTVYLPDGNWIDYWTGENHSGNTHIMKHTPMDVMPIYIKEGSIIPHGPIKQHVYEEKNDLRFDVYLKETGSISYRYFEDDGKTFDYEKGIFNEFEINVENTSQWIRINFKCTHEGLKTAGNKSIAIKNARTRTNNKPNSRTYTNTIQVSKGISQSELNGELIFTIPNDINSGAILIQL